MFRVVLLKKAEKGLEKLPVNYQRKAAKYIDLISVNTFVGIKLEGDLAGWYKIKIPPIRIIYRPDIENKIIWIRAIGFRGGIYKK